MCIYLIQGTVSKRTIEGLEGLKDNYTKAFIQIKIVSMIQQKNLVKPYYKLKTPTSIRDESFN